MGEHRYTGRWPLIRVNDCPFRRIHGGGRRRRLRSNLLKICDFFLFWWKAGRKKLSQTSFLLWSDHAVQADASFIYMCLSFLFWMELMYVFFKDEKERNALFCCIACYYGFGILRKKA